MAQMTYRGAYRTAVAYLLIVMGGTFVVVFPAISLLARSQDRSLGYATRSPQAILSLHLRTFLQFAASTLPLIWLLAGALLYLCALALQKLKVPLLSRLLLAGISAYLSFRILPFIAPVGWPSLSAVYLTMFGTGLLGAAFGFFAYPRICQPSFQAAPLWSGHRIIFGAWAVLLLSSHGYAAYRVHQVQSVNDPGISFVFVKWSPGEGDVHEEFSRVPDSRLPHMRDVEIQELRAAGLTGSLHMWGNTSLSRPGENCRVVLVMSRGIRETVDLPKPSVGDILYIQTEQGWKAFPPSTPTLPRTIRLTLAAPDETNTYPRTKITVDVGLGHPDPKFGIPAFDWTPKESGAPLPFLLSQSSSGAS